MAENLQIRLSDPGEADRLAEIEAICFPPAEAASHEEVVKRMGAFPENFVVAVKDEQIVGFINGGTTDKPQINQYSRMNFIMISLFTERTGRSRRYSD